MNYEIMKSQLLYFLIIFWFLFTGGSCKSPEYKILKNKINQESRYNYFVNSFFDISDSYSIKFIYQKNYFQSLVIYQAGKNEFLGYGIETIKKNRDNKDSQTYYTVSQCSDTILQEILDFYDSINFDRLKTDSLITGYNHNWLDCTNDVFIDNKGNREKIYSFHCIHQQDTSIAEIEYAYELIKEVQRVFSFNDSYNRFTSILPKGESYNRGIFDVYILTDLERKNWESTLPQRKYQHRISDSITKIVSLDLTSLLRRSESQYAIDEYCYSAFNIVFDNNSNKWILDY